MTQQTRVRCVLILAAVTTAATIHRPLAATAFGARAAKLRPALVFVSTRDHPSGTLNDASEIYLMEGDRTTVRRLTDDAYGDGLPAISPDGTRIVFDSNRKRVEGQPANTQHLFLMKV